MNRVECWWVGKDRYTSLEWALAEATARGVAEILHEITTHEINVIKVAVT